MAGLSCRPHPRPERRSAAPRRAVRRGLELLGALILAQGAIGYAQYFSGLPAGLVWVHVTVAVVIWIVTIRLFLAHARPRARSS